MSVAVPMSEALYYPYTSIQSLDALKAMALYFDRIHIINPFEASVGIDRPNAAEMDALEDNGIIQYISPSKLLENYESTIEEAIKKDLANPKFRLICRNAKVKYWLIYESKIPQKLRSTLEKRSTKIHQKLSLPARTPERGLLLPVDFGESIMINHALCATDRFSLTPITDDRIHHKLLMLKFQASDSDFLKKLLVDYGFIKDIKIDLAAIDVISESVPMLYGASTTDILEFRDENKEALDRFKTEMGKVITEVESSFWDEDFYKKVIDIIDAKVKPSLQHVRDSMETNKNRFARLARKGAALLPLPILVTLLPGCDPIYGVLASAGALAVEEYLESLRKDRTIHKNSFAFLFETQKRFT